MYVGMNGSCRNLWESSSFNAKPTSAVEAKAGNGFGGGFSFGKEKERSDESLIQAISCQ